MKRLLLFLLAVACVGFVSCSENLDGEDIIPNQPQEPIPPSTENIIKINSENVVIGTHYWKGIAYGNGKFVAIATVPYNSTHSIGGGYISTSNDGTTWTAPVWDTSNQWFDIAYGNGIFVIISATGSIRTSIDGVSWTPVIKIDGSSIWNSIKYCNDRFVAIGSKGKILTSTDGTNWEPLKQVGISNLKAITYGNGLYVVIGDNGEIISSSNGENWKINKISYLDYSEDITYGNGQFVLVGHHENVGYISTSIDGITWSEPQYIGLYDSLSISFYCIAYSQKRKRFIIGGYAGYTTISYDGNIWETLSKISDNSIYDILDI